MLLTVAILFPLVLLAFIDWKKGLFVSVIVAVLQDPLRKLTPDQPVYFVVLVGFVFGVAWLGALTRGLSLNPNRIFGWKQRMGKPVAFFLVLLLLQAGICYARFGSPILPAVGMLSYLAPVPALVLGYQFALRSGTRGVINWLRFYVVIAVIALTSVYLQYAGINWRVLGEVGSGLTIYGPGVILTTHSGFFRASEIAAWHAATAACFLFLVATEKKVTFNRIILTGIITALLVGIGLLTGRRKMVVEIAIFIFAYLFLVLLLHRHSSRLAIVVLLTGLTCYVAVIGFLGPDKGDTEYKMERYHLYVERGKTVIDEAPDRVNRLGLQPVRWAINRFGLFGAGLGVGSQGVEHFGVQSFGGAGEGGLGKITMELGVPGLALAAWMAIVLLKHIFAILKSASIAVPRLARLSYGLMAFLVANGATFVVATQAYGDVFILISLGLALGFLLAIPELIAIEARKTGTTRSASCSTGVHNFG